MTLGKKLHMVIVQVAWGTELFELVELYCKDGHEIAEHSAMILEETG